MEKIIWTDRVKCDVLQSGKEYKNILQKIKRRKSNWISHILRRNCLWKHVIEGKKEEGGGREEEEEVSNHWLTLRKIDGTVNWKRKLQIAFSGEMAL
jgi:hypothetical protein